MYVADAAIGVSKRLEFILNAWLSYIIKYWASLQKEGILVLVVRNYISNKKFIVGDLLKLIMGLSF